MVEGVDDEESEETEADKGVTDEGSGRKGSMTLLDKGVDDKGSEEDVKQTKVIDEASKKTVSGEASMEAVWRQVCAWLRGQLVLGHVVCFHNPSKWTWPVLMEVGSLPPCYLQPSCPCQVGPDRAYGEALSGQGCEDQVGVCR